MMESNFYSDDFERLIREKTEQYKMYPSEKVWKGVYSSLHTKKRWFIGGMSILVTGIIVVAGRELILPAAHTGPLKKQPLVANLIIPKITPENAVLPAPFTEFRGGGHSAAFIHGTRALGPLQDASAAMPEGISEPGAIDPMTGQQQDPANAIGQTPDISTVSAALTAVTDVAVKGSSQRTEASGSTGTHAVNHGGNSNTTETRPSDTYESYLTRIRTGNGLAFGPGPYEGQVIIATFASLPGNIPAPGLQISLHPAIANRSMSRIHATDLFQPVIADDDDDESIISDTTTIVTTRQKINWLQDYAVYSLHPSPRKNKAYWQIYFAPTENMRMLSGGNAPNPKSNMTGTAGPQMVSTNAKFPSNLLQNMGFEAGGSFLYKLSRTVSIKAGLQFNYSRLTLKAHSAAGAPPAPNSNFGGPLDSAAAGTAGPLAQTARGTQLLHNEYFQLSAPVGLELRVWGNDRLQVNIAATVQPAYLLNTNAYLMTTEDNNYVKSSALFRKWNVDGSAEAYISYKIGLLRLQVGPEFRYQFLSSYSDQYPLRENLASYGLKIGIIKAIR